MMRTTLPRAMAYAASWSAGTLCAWAVLAFVSASPLAAQGTLSGLGFGYPVGGLSTRATATGGAFGEFDAISPRNPAALGGLTRTLITVQTEPEFRTVTFGSVKERTTAERIPLLLVAFPMRHRTAVAFSGTTFLDRSYSTSTVGNVNIDGTALPTTDQTDVRGSIADLRAGLGWRINDRLSVGVGGHLFTGDNLVVASRLFADTTSLGSVLDSSRVTYFGTAISVGTEVELGKGLAASASYRSGGSLESRITDTVRSRGNVPNRLGAGLRYAGLGGSIFAVGIETQQWTRMQGLGSALVQAHDVTNWHAGGEVQGPHFLGSTLLVRAGFARNTLPFGVSNRSIRESRVTGGLGLPLAQNFATLDFSVQRAMRTLGGGGAKESAWLLGVGIQIRPTGP